MTAHIIREQKIGEIDKGMLDIYAPYIAGLLDGEGTFTIRWNRRSRRPSFSPLIMVQMTHEGVISFLGKTLQVTYTTKVRKSRRTYYVLRITTKHEMVMMLIALSPWLIVKKEHAQIILEFIAMKERKELTRKEIMSKRAKLYLRIRQLNLKGRPFDPDELSSVLEDSIENYFKNK
jgi:hypothetical protein